ncbi:uncharacterized protein EV154DRAFT_552102 [Mucor mucedo]|uniref:uncharacterized protein n=1 Tax=Mucor mucedo TaxID=29922 RepID=UPI002220F0F2|nr:uncharacterized protein EV154DRAFT_552102 [Mucor mucedo]KAI7890692.1 hypothetical protein EV154DRAFT_552102 [Mucor mucedo]
MKQLLIRISCLPWRQRVVLIWEHLVECFVYYKWMMMEGKMLVVRESVKSRSLWRKDGSLFCISTYQTDFVLVNESKLHNVIKTLRQDGFDVEEDGCFTVTEEEEDYEDTALLSPVDPTQFLLDTDVLDNELQCVGLNRHYRSDWVITVLKILCYPDLVQSEDHKRFCSFVATSEDISLIADTHIVSSFEENMLMKEQDGTTLRVIQVHFSGSNVERCGIVRCISKPLSMEANINMFYLSTFMTANIIVSVDDLERAVNILS